MTQAAPTLAIDLTQRVVENVYYPPTQGYISAASQVASGALQMPFYGMVSLSAESNAITLTTGGRRYDNRALAFCCRDLEFTAAARISLRSV